MLLQADPTIQFALGHHVGRVLYKDLEIKSPYNTYIHKGLPPGPIASPGVASLAAAAHPANVPYLYFVATRDGHHEFRMTLNEHVNAIRQIRGKAPPQPKPLMLASAAPSKRSTKTTIKKSPAKTVSKSTSRPATKTTVKAVPKKSTKSTATTKKKRPTTQTKRPTTQTTSTTR